MVVCGNAQATNFLRSGRGLKPVWAHVRHGIGPGLRRVASGPGGFGANTIIRNEPPRCEANS